ncbi:hypothetical protein Despr_2722 [Desulfobulbus propionicus DSM 2032]|uniref:Ferredoxin n=1 Tax=Desulfobulbus propionicus (strain ATCC 33891 / DSM 2032 / VKM B-1956 / 1pr3) TaxID=577650 RepID=A0A7U3YNY5_DESPD|nr:ferredoxin [Desulfobulbus propionicus]ADW18857.1 hypothetical protein Despr_2722 [Desulfobulbus propionicus DSM 2032]
MPALAIDSYRCNGCGSCCEMCPEVFGLTPLTSRAQLLNPDQEVTEDVRRAAAFCPKKCILVSGEDIDA